MACRKTSESIRELYDRFIDSCRIKYLASFGFTTYDENGKVQPKDFIENEIICSWKRFTEKDLKRLLKVNNREMEPPWEFSDWEEYINTFMPCIGENRQCNLFCEYYKGDD